MARKPKPPVPERRFLGTRTGAGKGKESGEGSDGGRKKPPPRRSTDQLPKR